MTVRTLLIWVLVAAVAGGAFVLFSNSSSSSSEYSLAHLFPEGSTMVWVAHSPSSLLQNISKDDFPNLVATLSAQSQKAGFDVTDAQFYRDSGIDLSKSVGFAMVDMVPTPTVVLCMGVSDQQKFFAFLENNFIKDQPHFRKQVQSVTCVFLGQENAPHALCYVTQGYCVFYGSAMPQRDLATKFADQVLADKAKLAQNSNFVATLEGTGISADHDGYLYINYPKYFRDLTKATQQFGAPQQEQKMLKQLQSMIDEMLGVCMTSKLEGNKLHFSSYMHCARDSKILKAYENTQSQDQLLARLPKGALLTASYNINMQYGWPLTKDALSTVFTALPLGNQDIKNLDDLFGKAQEGIARELGIKIDIEKDIVLNFSGNMALVLYNLPSQQNIDFDMVLAAKLQDAGAATGLLRDIIEAIRKKQADAPITTIQIKDSQAHVFDLAKMQPNAKVAPTIGVFDGNLILATKQERFASIVNGDVAPQENLYQDIEQQDVIAGLKSGALIAGYLKFARLCREIVSVIPNPGIQKQSAMVTRFTDHFTTFTMSSKMRPSGVYQNGVVIADGDIVKQILTEVEKMLSGQ